MRLLSGKPVYTYSLKQGIRDGFLAPYKVVKVHIDRDVEGYRPEKGQLDRLGREVEDRIYNTKDFDTHLVLDALLAKYADEGFLNLDDTRVLQIPPLSGLGTPLELVKAFGGRPGFEQAVHDLQSELYRASA